ncbi:hypothetical protein V5O48_015918 [Marasmius crinis-equi]|uniref:Uncharacterized protein n=1 Tax=Marasmius crinis-equi TaxID=585013 RepID=A0ABR3ET82_9AGAR
MSSFARLTIFVFAAVATVSHAAPLTGMPSTQPPTLPIGSAGDITQSFPIAGSLPARELPVVGNLPVVDGLINDLPVVGSLPIRALPVVGNLPLAGGLTKDIPLVGGSSDLPLVGSLTKDLPIVGGLGLDARSLPVLADTKLPIVGDVHTDDDLLKARALPLPLQSILNDATTQLTPLLQQITFSKLDVNTLSPLVSQVGDILNDVTGKVAALSNVEGSGLGPVSVDDLSKTVGPFVTSVLSTFNTVMETSETETESVAHVLSGATTDLAGLLQSLKNVFGADIDKVLVPLLQTSGQALQMVNSLGLNSITSDLPLAGKVNEIVSGLKN